MSDFPRRLELLVQMLLAARGTVVSDELLMRIPRVRKGSRAKDPRAALRIDITRARKVIPPNSTIMRHRNLGYSLFALT